MHIPVQRIFRVLIGVMLGLFLLHGLTLLLRHGFGLSLPDWISARLDPNLEANIPNWFSTILLAGVAAAALLNHWLGRRGPAEGPLGGWFWLGFAVVYAALSLDEAARLHELLDGLGPGLKWIYFYAPIAALFFALCAYQLFGRSSTDPELRNWIIGGLLVTALGALVGEYLDYALDLTPVLSRLEWDLEEAAEMLGTIMVLMGCLRELERRFNVRFAVRAS